MRPRQHLAQFTLGALLWLATSNIGAAAAATSNHWAFQPLTPQPIPSVKDGSRVRNPVDAFVLARLEAAGLHLSSSAAPPALLRRLTFDLTGLPPTAEQIAAPTLTLPNPQTLTQARGESGKVGKWESELRTIERLLASPQFGERWARWWLDAAGYVDALNLDDDPENPKVPADKWRYRDYVVASLNADKPFDRFLLEQLAGDELTDWRNAPAFTDEMRTLLIATGFLRTAPDTTDIDELNTPDVHHTVLQETAENVAANLLGVTFHCARCHDHKYEPLTQRDYFSFLAHFAPAFNPQAWLRPKDRVLTDLPKSAQPAHAQQLAALDAEVKVLKQQQQTLRDRYRDQLLEARLPRVPAELRAEAKVAARTPFEKRSEEHRRLVGRFERLLRVTTDEVRAALTPTDKAEWERLDQAIATVNARRPVPPQIHAVFDTAKPTPVHILRRGEFDQPAETVEPALPVVLRPPPRPVGRDSVEPSNKRSEASAARISGGTPPSQESRTARASAVGKWSSTESHPTGATSGRRLALAQQLTAPDSPAATLVARVLMNRVWQQLFGRGLVETPANLGVSGAHPTHPELLDWLAAEFIRNGWQLKPMIRLLVTSSTYQQSSSAAADPALAARAQRADPANDLLWHQRLRRLESEMLRDSLLAVSGQLELRAGGPPVPTAMQPDGTFVLATNKLAHPQDAFRRSLYVQQRRTYHLSFLAAFDQPLLMTGCLRRTAQASVGQALTLLNDRFVLDCAAALARRVCAARPDTAARIELAFNLALGRPPSAEETRWCQALAEREGVRLLTSGTNLPAARDAALAHVCHTLLNTSEFLALP